MKGRSGIYDYNQNFFEEESPNLAYFLGWFMSDGYLSKNKNEITFGLKTDDRYILEMFRDWICPNKPISDFQKKNKSGTISFGSRISFSNKYLIGNLSAKYDLKSCKTGKEHLLFTNQPDLFRNFVRGLFDGDGCSHRLKNRCGVNIVSASTQLLEDLKRCLGYGYIYKASTINGWFVRGAGYVRDFYNFLYHADEPYLIRKKLVFEKYWKLLHDTDYTKPQLEFIQNNIDKLSFEEIAESLERKRDSIRFISFKHGFRDKIHREFTDDELEIITKMYIKNYNCKQISLALEDRNDKDVERQVKKLGLKEMCKNHQIKMWSPQEDELVIYLYKSGLNCMQISKQLGDRTPASIRCRTEKFGLTRATRYK